MFIYLDLVFVMDCTGSMGAYIASATKNICAIVEEIVISEKSDVRIALVEYRDHPPQVRNQQHKKKKKICNFFLITNRRLHL